MILAGAMEAAQDHLDALSDGIGEHRAAEKVAELMAVLKEDKYEAEIKAEKSLAKLERKLFGGDVDKKSVRALEKFIEKNAGTEAAKRAQRYLSAAGRIAAQ